MANGNFMVSKKRIKEIFVCLVNDLTFVFRVMMIKVMSRKIHTSGIYRLCVCVTHSPFWDVVKCLTPFYFFMTFKTRCCCVVPSSIIYYYISQVNIAK